MKWLLLIISLMALFLVYKKDKNKEVIIEKENTEKEWYKEYLKTEHWLQLREEALGRAGHRCQVCAYKKNLQVHHNTYENIGHEELEDLVVLCWKCHKTFHCK